MRVHGETGEGPVQQYRLYFLDGMGQIASAPYEFEAANDSVAIKVAEAFREGREIELWCRDRKVHS